MRSFFLLWIFFLAFSLFSFNTYNVVSMNATVLRAGTFTSSGTIHFLSFNLSVPSPQPYQTAYSVPSPLTHTDGNTYVSFVIDDPPNPFFYTVVTNVSVRERTTAKVHSSPRNVSPSFWSERYAQITENSSSIFEAVSLVAWWVHSTLTYDLSYAGKELTPEEILERKRGVCSHYTTLFNTILNASGIPARPIFGFSYGNNDWVGHAWSEVYLGQWVPVDVTWMEAGRLDAGRIEFTKVEDNTRAAASVDVGATINHEYLHKKEAHISLSGTQETTLSFFAGTFPEYIPFGGKGVVFAVFDGFDYRAFSVQLYPCKTDVLRVESPLSQLVVLEPHKRVVIAWVVSASYPPNKDYLYTCPMTIVAPGYRSASVNVHTRSGSITPHVARLSRSTLQSGEKQVLFYQGDRIFVLTENSLFNLSSPAFESQHVFYPTGKGLKRVIVAGSGSVNVLSFSVSPETHLHIRNMSLPSVAFAGPIPLSLCFSTDYSSSVVNFHTQKKYFFDPGTHCTNLTIHLPPGIHTINLTIVSGSESIYETYSLNITPPPSIHVNVEERKRKTENVEIWVHANGTLRDVYLYVNGTNYSLPLSSDDSAFLTLSLPPGTYPAIIYYQDLFGDWHQKPFEIFVAGSPRITRLPYLPEEPESTPSSCVPAFIIVFSFAAAKTLLIFLDARTQRKHQENSQTAT